jgi:hypothetical protein
MTMTYTDIVNAVDHLWPNVTNVDAFLERLTDSQVELITAFVERKNEIAQTD